MNRILTDISCPQCKDKCVYRQLNNLNMLQCSDPDDTKYALEN